MTGETIRAFPGMGLDNLPAAELAPDGKIVAAVRNIVEAGKVRAALGVWTAETGRWTDLAENPGLPSTRPFHFSADSKVLAFHGDDGSVRVWDLARTKLRLQLPATGGPPLGGVALSPDGKLLAREDREAKKVRIWDLGTGQELAELSDQPKTIGALAFSPDSKSLAGVDQPITIRLWDVAARKKVRDIRAHDFHVYHLAFTGDGTKLYAADGNGVSVWDPATGKPLDDRGGHRYTIWAAAWSPDGKRLASGAAYTDNVGRVWDPATGAKVLDLAGHKYGIEDVAYSLDGSLLATGSQDGTAKLWDPATGKELHTFAAGDGMVYRAGLLPRDGRFLVTGGKKGAARLGLGRPEGGAARFPTPAI